MTDRHSRPISGPFSPCQMLLRNYRTATTCTSGPRVGYTVVPKSQSFKTKYKTSMQAQRQLLDINICLGDVDQEISSIGTLD